MAAAAASVGPAKYDDYITTTIVKELYQLNKNLTNKQTNINKLTAENRNPLTSTRRKDTIKPLLANKTKRMHQNLDRYQSLLDELNTHTAELKTPNNNAYKEKLLKHSKFHRNRLASRRALHLPSVPRTNLNARIQSEQRLRNAAANARRRFAERMKQEELDYRLTLLRSGIFTPDEINEIILTRRVKLLIPPPQLNKSAQSDLNNRLTLALQLRRKGLSESEINNRLLSYRMAKLAKTNTSRSNSPEMQQYLTNVLRAIRNNPDMVALDPQDQELISRVNRLL